MEPTIKKTVDDTGRTLWVVEGGGMRFTHHQDWQAAVYLHQLQVAAGLPTAADPLRVLQSTLDATETTKTLPEMP